MCIYTFADAHVKHAGAELADQPRYARGCPEFRPRPVSGRLLGAASQARKFRTDGLDGNTELRQRRVSLHDGRLMTDLHTLM